MVLIKKIQVGEAAPKFWGKAYHEVHTPETVIAPIPFNWVVGWWHEGIHRVQRGPKDRMRKRFQIAYNDGFSKGYHQGYSDRSRIAPQLNEIGR